MSSALHLSLVCNCCSVLQNHIDNCSKDVINGLPDHLLCQILSKLSTKEAALTSLLSKRWRYLFALVPNLDFDNLSSLHHETEEQDQTSFIDFVDRVLELRGKEPVSKFSLRCGDGIVDEDVYPWILYMLRHGVLDLSLHVSPALVHWLPSKVFASKTLVRLKIGPKDGPRIKLSNVCLPKVKILNLDSVVFEEGQTGFANLLSGCPVLEELSLLNLAWDHWDSGSVSSKILKRLTLCCTSSDENPKTVILDTPNVVYLEYSDNIAHKYPKVNLDSLVEARISIRMTNDQKANVRHVLDSDEETEMVGNAMDLLMGICCVKTLYLSYDTLEILNSCCEAIPVFNNLTHLSIESNPEVGWDSLPDLLKRCPNLETLVFKGLLHKATNRCGDMCLCQGLEGSTSCLSSSPVKFLRILRFGERDDEDNVEMEIELIKNFLKKLPYVEQVRVHYSTSIDDDVVEVSRQLHLPPARLSLKCTIQVISDKISLPSALLI